MTNKIVVAAALGAVLAMGTAAVAQTNMKPPKLMKGLEKCYGIAKAGQNDCSTGTTSCSGESKQDGDKQAWISVPKGTCSKIVGGSTQPPKAG